MVSSGDCEQRGLCRSTFVARSNEVTGNARNVTLTPGMRGRADNNPVT